MAATASLTSSFVNVPRWHDNNAMSGRSRPRQQEQQRRRGASFPGVMPPLYNFFKDMLDKAFENDSTISKDESISGQIEGPENDMDEVNRAAATVLTPTQEKWRQMKTAAASPAGKTFDVDFFLVGVPNKDPSNDLYGSQVRISDRDRRVGQTMPEKPTISGVRIRFDDDSKCYCETESPFTKDDIEGEWKISEDGKQVRFRIQVTGYQRTVETKGSISSVSWSNEPDQTRQTSTVYSIPEGWMYGEAELVPGSKAGTVVWRDGILKVEQTVGLLGVSSKLSPCGKFSATEVFNTQTS